MYLEMYEPLSYWPQEDMLSHAIFDNEIPTTLLAVKYTCCDTCDKI